MRNTDGALATGKANNWPPGLLASFDFIDKNQRNMLSLNVQQQNTLFQQPLNREDSYVPTVGLVS